ncbi:hypothetical protein KX816_17600 [Sphingosinicellaceae bacterium]|nr:hypothetical protein KX816_17600 [Sphingosinicellaceae bacterium]
MEQALTNIRHRKSQTFGPVRDAERFDAARPPNRDDLDRALKQQITFYRYPNG